MEDFVFSDPTLLAVLSGTDQYVSRRENLLISQNKGELEVSLYLEPGLLRRLRETHTFESLFQDSQDDFFLALEGVSHFLYTVKRAVANQPFSLFELELQAEVDKFVTGLFLLGSPSSVSESRGLHQLLFDDVNFADDLNQAVEHRYRSANHYASRYCRYLQRVNRERNHYQPLFNDLRMFYHMSQEEKVRRIDNALYSGYGTIGS